MIELTASLLESDQEQPEIFALLAGCLTALENAPARTSNIWPFFQLRLATALGFGPSFKGEFVKAMTAQRGVLNLKSGEISEHSEPGYFPHAASRTALRAFAVLARAHLSDIVRMELSPEAASEVSSMVMAYLKFHVEDSYPNRSSKVFAQLAG